MSFASPYPADGGLAARFAWTVTELKRAVASTGDRRRPGGAVAAPLILLIWSRLNRIATRFARLAEHMRAGTLPAPRFRAVSSAALPDAAPPGSEQRPRTLPPRDTLPRRHGWLSRMMWEVRGFGGPIERLLSDPEMLALVEAAPQARRLLRPLCRMLGIKLPPVLQRPRIERARIEQARIEDADGSAGFPRPDRPGGEPGQPGASHRRPDDTLPPGYIWGSWRGVRMPIRDPYSA